MLISWLLMSCWGCFCCCSRPGFWKKLVQQLGNNSFRFVSRVAIRSSFSVEAGWLGHEGGGVEHGLELQHGGNEQEEKTRAGCSQQEFLLEGPEGHWQHRAVEGGALEGDGAGDGCGRWECWQSLCFLSSISILDF